VYEEQQLSYRELNQRANQLAHHLQSLGVAPETFVALCLRPSAEMVIALLAILKAGAAYLPLDPAYPQERLSLMLEDARIDLVLSQSELLELLPEHGARIITLDTEWGVIAQESTQNPGSAVTADNLAYVIYTSGSTGKPKGALVSHRNVLRLFKATDDWYHFDEHDVWTLFHSYAFDFSVWELWGALLYGGRLVVVPLWLVAHRSFGELLCREQVTVLNQRLRISPVDACRERSAGETRSAGSAAGDLRWRGDGRQQTAAVVLSCTETTSRS